MQANTSLKNKSNSNPVKELLSLLNDDMGQVNDIILKEMRSDVALIPQLAGYLIASGGKRLRPFLLINTARLFDVEDEYSVNAGCALEMIHSYSLVHDDLPSMDNDDFRRGKPTIHIKWDEATAVLVGDALQAFAYQILSSEETHPKSEVRLNLIRTMSEASGFGLGL